MIQIRTRKVILVLLGATLALGSLVFGFAKVNSVISRRHPSAPAPRMNKLPRVVLWAWERPTDLRFINPKETGVAFLARTILLRRGDVVVRPRLQPLKLPDTVQLVAVARVEADSANHPDLSEEQRRKLAEAITEMAGLPDVNHIQIDFDATLTEREFYRQVIVDVRRRLPGPISLSITALASWCTYDNWLSEPGPAGAIDEAVPMLFRMAGDGKQIANRLEAGEDFIAPQCRHSYGISTDEPRSGLSAARRLYVFNPDPWTEDSVRAILESSK